MESGYLGILGMWNFYRSYWKYNIHEEILKSLNYKEQMRLRIYFLVSFVYNIIYWGYIKK